MAERPIPRIGGPAPEQSGLEPGESAEEEHGRTLPLQAAVDAPVGGWVVRLPVRAEQVTVTKESVVIEDVRVWRASHEETRQVKASVREERLHVDSGDGG